MDERAVNHQITKLLEQRAADLRGHTRLILRGYGNFRDQHERAHARMVGLKIPHVFVEGPKREHLWESGWVPEAAKLLLEDAGTGP